MSTRAAVTMTVEVDEGLVGTTELPAVREACTASASSLVEQLGLPVEVETVVTSPRHGRATPVAFYVEGARCLFPEDDVAPDLVASAQGQWSGDLTRGLSQLVRQLAAHEQAAVIGAACYEALLCQPEVMVTPAVADAWTADEAGSPLAPALSHIVSVGVAVHDRETIMGCLRATDQLSALDAAEVAIDRLASRSIELRISRSALNDLLTVPALLDPARGEETRATLADVFGFGIPAIDVVPVDEPGPDSFMLRTNNLSGRRHRGLLRSQVMVDAEALEEPQLAGSLLSHPVTQRRMAVVDVDLPLHGDWSTSDAGQFLLMTVGEEILRHGWRLLTLTRLESMLTAWRTSLPTTVATAVDRFGAPKICRVLRTLLRQRVTVRQLLPALSALAACAEETDSALVERLRGTWPVLLPAFHEGSPHSIYAYGLHPDLERALEQSLEDEIRDHVIDSVRDLLVLETGGTPCMLTTRSLREPVELLMRERFPRLRVASYDEVIGHTTIVRGPNLSAPNGRQ